MAIESRGFNIGIVAAAADLSAKQFYICKITGSMAANLTTVAGEPALGIIQNKAKSGEALDIMSVGISKVMTGTGNLAAGAQYEAASDGSAITAEVGKVGLGVVLQAANAGELATVTIGLPCGAVIHA